MEQFSCYRSRMATYSSRQNYEYESHSFSTPLTKHLRELRGERFISAHSSACDGWALLLLGFNEAEYHGGPHDTEAGCSPHSTQEAEGEIKRKKMKMGLDLSESCCSMTHFAQPGSTLCTFHHPPISNYESTNGFMIIHFRRGRQLINQVFPLLAFWGHCT